MMKKKILVISYDFIKKVNIRVYEELSKYNNLNFICLKRYLPKPIFCRRNSEKKTIFVVKATTL